MCGFYKLILLLICIGAITGNCVEVVPRPDTATEQQIVRLSNIAEITEGKLERTKRGLLDYLLYGLYEYFDYSDESDSEEDEKYLICRNCTIIISQSNEQGSPEKPSTMAPPIRPNGNTAQNGNSTLNGNNTPKGGVIPAAALSNVPMPPETPVDIPPSPADTTQA